ncbi:PREDICTED: beta-defensin 115 [Chinchilla lanigera]|uniref:beta-defensin 115 n=1 Tax=Chinchilla lanigera TaxID=34839 RepID=UPI00038F17F9|nr:PREDICTED: beta-defensin 115 [Chinchilla lanigera]
MSFLMLTLTICGLLSQLAAAAWSIPKCWNNVGHCRRRCLDTERYKLLCKNKVSCCIPIRKSYANTPKPPPPLIPNLHDITIDISNWKPASPGLSDEVTMDDTESEETTATIIETFKAVP